MWILSSHTFEVFLSSSGYSKDEVMSFRQVQAMQNFKIPYSWEH